MTGYVSGSLTDEDGAAELLRTAEESLKAAEHLGCPRLNLHGTGLDGQGLPVVPVSGEPSGAMWMAAQRTLTRIAELGERAGVTFTLENLNTAVDHPGVPLAKAADTLALVAAVNRPGLRMNLDLYHAQIGEGNLIELVRSAHGAGLIGEIQVADVPGRCEPGTGEINYPAIARTLADIGYEGHRRHGGMGLRRRRQRGRTGALPGRLHPLTGTYAGHPPAQHPRSTAIATPQATTQITEHLP
jgi:hydroxypyruvate isomerase